LQINRVREMFHSYKDAPAYLNHKAYKGFSKEYASQILYWLPDFIMSLVKWGLHMKLLAELMQKTHMV